METGALTSACARPPRRGASWGAQGVGALDLHRLVTACRAFFRPICFFRLLGLGKQALKTVGGMRLPATWAWEGVMWRERGAWVVKRTPLKPWISRLPPVVAGCRRLPPVAAGCRRLFSDVFFWGVLAHGSRCAKPRAARDTGTMGTGKRQGLSGLIWAYLALSRIFHVYFFPRWGGEIWTGWCLHTATMGTGRRLGESGVGFLARVGRGCVAAPGDGRAPLQRGAGTRSRQRRGNGVRGSGFCELLHGQSSVRLTIL
ncbi:MAG: hypothetical protein JWR26_2411 [Pedosphaera sp.]|nr:hypothetical protein [Pedosphaera sp.]